VSVKKGDLVLFTEEAKAYSYGALYGNGVDSEIEDKIMIVVKGPYEGIQTRLKTSSSLSVVVDLLIDGDLLKGVPTKFLIRTAEVKQETSSEEIQRG